MQESVSSKHASSYGRYLSSFFLTNATAVESSCSLFMHLHGSKVVPSCLQHFAQTLSASKKCKGTGFLEVTQRRQLVGSLISHLLYMSLLSQSFVVSFCGACLLLRPLNLVFSKIDLFRLSFLLNHFCFL